jgi:hypothetical protein
LRVEDRAAEPEGESVESRVLEAMRGFAQGEERDLTRATTATVQPQEVSTFLWDLLRDSAVVLRTGVRTIDTTKKSIKWPTLTGDITADYYDELEEIDESDPTLDDYELTVAKKIAAIVKASVEALEDSDPSLRDIVTKNLGTVLGLKLDRELIAGSGENNEIQGMLNLDGVQELDMEGAPLADYSWFYKARGMLAQEHVTDPLVVLMNTRVDTGLSLLKEYAAAESNSPLQRPSDVPVPFVSSQVPITTGSGEAPDTSSVLVYAPSRVIVVRRIGVDAAQILIDASAAFETDAVLFKGRVRAALGTVYPKAIVKLTNVASPPIDGAPLSEVHAPARKARRAA